MIKFQSFVQFPGAPLLMPVMFIVLLLYSSHPCHVYCTPIVLFSSLSCLLYSYCTLLIPVMFIVLLLYSSHPCHVYCTPIVLFSSLSCLLYSYCTLLIPVMFIVLLLYSSHPCHVYCTPIVLFSSLSCLLYSFWSSWIHSATMWFSVSYLSPNPTLVIVLCFIHFLFNIIDT